MLAIASCTSADGLMPPADVGTSQQAMPPLSPMAPEPASAQPEAQAASAAMPAAPAATAVSAAGATTAAASAPAAAPAFAGPEPAASPPQGGAVVTAAATRSTIQLAPVTGSTPEVVSPLTQRLAAHAQERGIAVAGNGSLPTHILRGYLSQISDKNSTTVIYVWDVVDPAGARLHRIQGTAKVKGAGGWAAVSAKTMQAIADRTIDDFAAWLAGGAG
jgi:hypothetical protein